MNYLVNRGIYNRANEEHAHREKAVGSAETQKTDDGKVIGNRLDFKFCQVHWTYSAVGFRGKFGICWGKLAPKHYSCQVKFMGFGQRLALWGERNRSQNHATSG